MEQLDGWKRFFRDDARALEYEGLGLDEARQRAEAAAMARVRVIEALSGMAVTLDFVPARLNLLADGGVVVLAGWF